MKSICIYCGASEGVDKRYLDIAHEMGVAVAQRGLKLVYGGGGTGLMGALADGALSANGEVIGIIPELFNTIEKAHDRLSRIEVVVNMHERKARMAELVDGFVALPGGFGTLEELFETLTWYQVGLHKKPIAILNAFNYFDPLIKFLNHIKQEKFTRSKLEDLYLVSDSPRILLDHFSQRN